jgi:hypothetical protein
MGEPKKTGGIAVRFKIKINTIRQK